MVDNQALKVGWGGADRARLGLRFVHPACLREGHPIERPSRNERVVVLCAVPVSYGQRRATANKTLSVERVDLNVFR